MEATHAHASLLDQRDPLKEFRKQFLVSSHHGNEQAYFLGNSLGLQPKRTKAYLDKVLQQWNDYGVEAFFMGEDPWMDYHAHLQQPLANIIGCKPGEITVMNQLTVNLHLMMVSFYRPMGTRTKILCEAKAFPSDQYMFETHLRFHGLDPNQHLVEVQPRAGEEIIRLDDILQSIETHGDELALVLWGGINYYSGQVFDMRAIAKAAHQAGANVGFDLAHAAGNIPLSLHDWNADFACWCNYKYLNGGPGAVGAAFIHERYHRDPSLQRFAGWWGYEKASRFRMEQGFKPIQTAEGWQLSTPSPLQYACLRASLEVFMEAGWDAVQEKRKDLNAWLWFLLDELNRQIPENPFTVITPRVEKGCQVSLLMHRNGREVFDALTAEGIITDWREPNVIRLAPVPLYNTYTEVFRFYETMRAILLSPNKA
jgi:kynureninase